MEDPQGSVAGFSRHVLRYRLRLTVAAQKLKPVVSNATPIRIVIAGEHSIFRDGLRRLLEAESGFVIAAESADGSAAPRLVVEFTPDVLLLGFATIGPSLTDTVHELAAVEPPVRTIVLTDRVDTPAVSLALQLGARGVVLKDSTPAVLFECIRNVMAGRFWLGDERVDGAVPNLRKLEAARRRSKLFGLTRREIEIIRGVVAGYTNREIAERACISENTVKSHLMHIFNKSGASSRVELALFAAHHRLLDGL
jgi:DNA-binding NarL/FixJ family response regulator